MEDMTEKLSNLDDNGDQLGKHLDLSDGSTHKRCHNEKRSERRARTERLLSDIDKDQGKKRMEIVTSQQSCTLEQNRGVIEEELSRAISEEKKHKFQDLYEEHSDSIRNDQDTMKSFCSKYNVEEKHVIAYVNHLKDIEIRKDIRTRAAQERRRQEAERTYKDFQWDNLIEGGKVQKLRVRELDLYLNKHGLTTVGRKLDKVKAIRCHYYRQNKETVITEELSSDEDDVEFEDEESESGEAESDDDYVFVDLDEQPEIGTSSTIQFVSDEQIFTVVVQGP
ncbi:hypothetical protein AWC38_SpisGene6154 [Stylophora pistillata]|uniref:SAP domain-containing protein n=1 Tax=Stylophora pistillata TaxID=50429 RepID=A0A2B4SGU4_STYPI|nr:hypothetical protein AWC38_SpisGene6154 [Stylophora pistillata]